MKLCGVGIAVVALFGLISVSYADNDVSKNAVALPPMQLHDYSVELKMDRDTYTSPTAPSGLTTLTRETKQPFVGLSFTKPFSK